MLEFLDFFQAAKACGHKTEDGVKRMSSVAYVVRPRSEHENACLCFSLLSKPPSQKPWSRDPDLPDPSRSVILDLQNMSEWRVKSVAEPKLPTPEDPFHDDTHSSAMSSSTQIRDSALDVSEGAQGFFLQEL